MRKALAITAAVVLATLGLVLLLVMLNVTGLPLCGDREAVRTADECIDATIGERAFGLVCGWLAIAVAALGIAFSIRYAARGTAGRRLALAVVLAPVLGLLMVAFAPVSF